MAAKSNGVLCSVITQILKNEELKYTTFFTSVQAVANDIHLVSCALSLPIYEPLDSARLEQLSIIAMSCLYCAVCVAASSSILTASTAVSPKCSSSGMQTAKQATQGEDESLDGLAAGLVEKTLEIYSAMSDMIRNSTRTGGDVRIFRISLNNLMFSRTDTSSHYQVSWQVHYEFLPYQTCSSIEPH